MLGNYLIITMRALLRSRTHAFINLFGLAIGMAACLIILLYVRHERSYDDWLPQAERVYQVQTFGQDPDTGERLDQQGTTRPVAAALEKDFSDIEAISILDSDDLVILKDGLAVQARDAKAAGAAFFDIIQLPFLRGDRRTALRDPSSITLSRTEAMKLFGSLDVIGRTLTIVREGERRDLRVTGVFDDLPKNSHMQFGFVRRFNPADEPDCSWGCVSGMIYLKLRPGASADAINDRMPAWEKRNVPERDMAGSPIGKTFDWRLVNVNDIHLGPAQDGDRPGNDRGTILTFSIIAMLILAIACANFVNLATARATQRAREVAIRKVLGARRHQLVAQFLGESLLFSSIATILALALVELALPAFSAFLDAKLELRYLGEGGLLPLIAAAALLVGLCGGLYPAFFLARFEPAAVLKANRSSAEAPGTGRIRTSLVVAQFAVSITLIISTMVVFQQTVFARTADLGFRRDGLILISGLSTPEAAAAQATLAREIRKIEGVSAAAGTMIVPGSGRTLFTTVQVPGRHERVKLGWYSVEPDFFRTMGVTLRAGRELSERFARDSFPFFSELTDAQAREALRGLNVVVNETAARRLGWRNPQSAVGKQIGVAAFDDSFGLVPASIVGVVQDSRFRSARQSVEPIIYYDGKLYLWMAVRYQAAEPEIVRGKIEAVWSRMLPQVPFEAVYAEDQLADMYRDDVARGQTFGGFALLAIVIAALGLFGLAAFTAERRTREIGVRKVFGATVADIVRLLVWQFSKPVIVANLIAWPVAWWIMRDWLNGFDVRIGLGPAPFVLAGILAFCIAVGTVAGHALRIARTNPIRALRYE